MVERNELITVCRQVGGMMEAGVDILRITRVLRAQTENPRLLQLYDALDHDMTMGHGLADAMSHAPDVFSPFMVLMVQQGEARNDLAGSFFKIADYIQKDGELAQESSSRDASQASSSQPQGEAESASDLLANRVLDSRMNAPTAPLTVIALDGLIDRLQTFALRALTVISGLLLSLAGVWWSVEMGWLERRWSYPTAFSVAAIFMGSSGILIQRRIKSERRREARCSFCGRPGTEGDELQRAPRFAGAAICSRCASIAARQHGKPENSQRTQTPGDQTPGDQTPGDQTPGDQTPNDEPRPESPNDAPRSSPKAKNHSVSTSGSTIGATNNETTATQDSLLGDKLNVGSKPARENESSFANVPDGELHNSSTRNQARREVSSNKTNQKIAVEEASAEASAEASNEGEEDFE